MFSLLYILPVINNDIFLKKYYSIFRKSLSHLITLWKYFLVKLWQIFKGRGSIINCDYYVIEELLHNYMPCLEEKSCRNKCRLVGFKIFWHINMIVLFSYSLKFAYCVCEFTLRLIVLGHSLPKKFKYILGTPS